MTTKAFFISFYGNICRGSRCPANLHYYPPLTSSGFYAFFEIFIQYKMLLGLSSYSKIAKMKISKEKSHERSRFEFRRNTV
jgi:hypothetical protein